MDKNIWRLIIDEPLGGSLNMAVDEAILQRRIAGEVPSTLRLYSWDRRVLSCGYFQQITPEVARFCEQQQINLVRRPTGGGLVIHDREITFSVIFSRRDIRRVQRIAEYYRVIASCIQSALERLGVVTAMEEKVFSGKDISFFCFHKPTKYDLLVAGKKICGSAQRRFQDTILQQGSLTLLPGLFPSQIRQRDIYQAIRESFERELRITLVEAGLSPQEENLAGQLEKDKYSRASWNYQERYQGDQA